MVLPFFKIFSARTPSRKDFLFLAIGNNQVEGLVFQKTIDKKIKVLAYDREPIELFGIFETRNFYNEVLKRSIFKILKSLQLERGKFTEVFVNLGPRDLKSYVSYINFHRKNPGKISEKEKDDILDFAFKESANELYEKFSRNATNSAKKDIKLIRRKILDIKISGYSVPTLVGYTGKDIGLRILSILGYQSELKRYTNILQYFGFKKIDFRSKAEGLADWLEQKKKDSEKYSATILDVTSNNTQVFLIQKNCLDWVGEFKIGENNFLEVLSKKFGMQSSMASQLVEKFIRGKLEKNLTKELEKYFSLPFNTWCDQLKYELEEFKKRNFIFVQSFHFLENTILIPLLRSSSGKNTFGELIILENFKISSLRPKDFSIKANSRYLNNPLATRITLLALGT